MDGAVIEMLRPRDENKGSMWPYLRFEELKAGGTGTDGCWGRGGAKMAASL